MTPEQLPEGVLAAFGFDGARVAVLGGGLINATFVVDPKDGGRWVLQRLHPIFAPEVNDDIDAVTSHLAAKGLMTPRLRRTTDGATFARGDDGGVYRVLSFVPGRSHERVTSPALARAAGALVGVFHGGLADLRHDFRFRRAHVHDTPHHVGRLVAALDALPAHPARDSVGRLADRLFALAHTLPPIVPSALPQRIAHGDLKISNLLFAGPEASPRGVCLVDLDTVATMALPHELGDALRSWCNPLGEDVREAALDLGLFEAACAGYLGAFPGVHDEEAALLPTGLATIALELSARFATDALEERYFGWDPARFESRSEHALVRALGQLSLAQKVADARAEAERMIAALRRAPR
jgi:Ser/Thr protein kinase RdoA (MazF antagonist)